MKTGNSCLMPLMGSGKGIQPVESPPVTITSPGVSEK